MFGLAICVKHLSVALAYLQNTALVVELSRRKEVYVTDSLQGHPFLDDFVNILGALESLVNMSRPK
jgi:hypothetical protein